MLDPRVERRLNFAFAGLCLFGCVGLAAMIGFPATVFDNYHFDDTIFLSNLGWRVYSGGVPTVDFPDFLGGLMAQFVAWAMMISGPTVKAVEYAMILQMAILVALVGAVSWRRIDLAGAGMLALLVTALILTRAPLEMSMGLTETHSAHSFLYNRYGTCIALILGVYAMCPTVDRQLDFAVGVLGGIAAYSLSLAKPTFFVFAPAYLLALLVMGRGAALLGSLTGLGIALIFIDPGASRFMAAFQYAGEQMSGRIDPLEIFRKMIRQMTAHSASVIVALATIVAGFFLAGVRFVRPALAILILCGGGLVLTATMGWMSLLGHQLVPFILIVPFYIFLSVRVDNLMVRTVALLAPFGVILPHAANTFASTLHVMEYSEFSLFDEGPFQNYVAYDYRFLDTVGGGEGQSDAAIRALALDDLSRFVTEAESQGDVIENRTGPVEEIRNSVKYVVFAEGYNELQEIPGIEDLGIITNTRVFDFAFAFGATPVWSYPPFPEKGSPEIRSSAPFGEEVDVVAMAVSSIGDLTEDLTRRMGDDFELCRASQNWDIYTRRSADVPGCNEIAG